MRRAIDIAYDAQTKWEATPGLSRGKILFKAAEIMEEMVDELSRLLTSEEGKTL